jgi:hypothetical protein
LYWFVDAGGIRHQRFKDPNANRQRGINRAAAALNKGLFLHSKLRIWKDSTKCFREKNNQCHL